MDAAARGGSVADVMIVAMFTDIATNEQARERCRRLDHRDVEVRAAPERLRHGRSLSVAPPGRAGKRAAV